MSEALAVLVEFVRFSETMGPSISLAVANCYAAFLRDKPELCAGPPIASKQAIDAKIEREIEEKLGKQQ